MRIVCPLKPLAERGGSHNFLLSISAHAPQHGAEMLFGMPDSFRDDDVVLVNSFLTPVNEVMTVWRKQIPLLLRLDGAVRDYGRFDNADQAQAQIAAIADEIIFQSEFCRRRLIQKWGWVRKSGRIIYNGVDTGLFSPIGKQMSFPGQVKVAYVSHSENLLKGFRQILYLARKLPHVAFIACTPPRAVGWPDEALGAMPPPPNLLLLGRVPREELPAVLRGCDIFASCAINDPCPNAVIEAMACGLPIWYHPSGGTPELVGDAGIAFSDDPASDIENLIEHHARLSELSRGRVLERFDIQNVAKQYVDAARDLLSRKKGIIRRLQRRLVGFSMSSNKIQLPELTIGYYLPCDLEQYEKVPGSVWIRCFQMIPVLKKLGITVRINPEPGETVDLAVILRLENEKGVTIAQNLRKERIPYIFDMVANYFDLGPLPYNTSRSITEEQRTSTLRILQDAVMVTAVSPWLADRAAFFHPRTVCIPDSVPDAFFEEKKDAADFERHPLRACYVGYAAKGKDLQKWLPVLRKCGIQVTVISEQEPSSELAGVQWKRWKYSELAEEIAKHEIGLAPRADMTSPYNMGHSSFKIASLMACGLPILASPVPSYAPLLRDGKAGCIIHDVSEFETALKTFMADSKHLNAMSQEARRRASELTVSNVAKLVAQTFRQAMAIAESETTQQKGSGFNAAQVLNEAGL
jgi:glycosyltransferase involved in cell wall biosynthesis